MVPSSFRLRFPVLLVAVSATLALGALPPDFDFSGHWSGTARSRGATAPLSADFVATSDPREFTGTAVLDVSPVITCTFNAKYRKKLKLHLLCDNNKKSTVVIRLDAATQTLAGSFPITGRHGTRRRATFTLSRAAG